MNKIEFLATSPLTSVQDNGRFGALKYGVAASGPMDRGAFLNSEILLNSVEQTAGRAAIECSTGRTEFIVHGPQIWAAFCGGPFVLNINGQTAEWEAAHSLKNGDKVEIVPSKQGNYGIIRFNKEIDIPSILNSQSTNMIAQLGGMHGRMIQPSEQIRLLKSDGRAKKNLTKIRSKPVEGKHIIRITWGLHSALFSTKIMEQFLASEFVISSVLDRMGVRLKDKAGVFNAQQKLSLVSDAIVPGDIQILGDGTPIVLMRDHQPTGGYPRIATVISADLDRFAQMRPGIKIVFTSVSVDHAHEILREEGAQ